MFLQIYHVSFPRFPHYRLCFPKKVTQGWTIVISNGRHIVCNSTVRWKSFHLKPDVIFRWANRPPFAYENFTPHTPPHNFINASWHFRREDAKKQRQWRYNYANAETESRKNAKEKYVNGREWNKTAAGSLERQSSKSKVSSPLSTTAISSATTLLRDTRLSFRIDDVTWKCRVVLFHCYSSFYHFLQSIFTETRLSLLRTSSFNILFHDRFHKILSVSEINRNLRMLLCNNSQILYM